MITFPTLDQDQLDQVNKETLAGKDALDVIKWAYAEYGDELVYACSFGAEGMVLIDLITRVKPDAKIIFLDTNFHFKETYDLIEEVKERYPKLRVDMLQPITPAEQEEQEGPELWKTNPDKCCSIRKLVPLEGALNQHTAWLSGLRRSQSLTRKDTQFVNKDKRFSSVKICPLIHWSWDDVWMYIKGFNLPYNPLHDQEYPSIGCVQCTAKVKDGEDLRSGRWSQTGKTECGLHK